MTLKFSDHENNKKYKQKPKKISRKVRDENVEANKNINFFLIALSRNH